MTITNPPPETTREPIEPIDDYRIQPDPGQLQQPVSHHVLGTMNILLLIFIAAVSFALFWVVATMLRVL